MLFRESCFYVRRFVYGWGSFKGVKRCMTSRHAHNALYEYLYIYIYIYIRRCHDSRDCSSYIICHIVWTSRGTPPTLPNPKSTTNQKYYIRENLQMWQNVSQICLILYIEQVWEGFSWKIRCVKRKWATKCYSRLDVTFCLENVMLSKWVEL